MTHNDGLAVSTLFIVGMWIGFVIRDRLPERRQNGRQLVAGSLVMSASAIGAVTFLAHFDSYAANIIARTLALILACTGFVASIFQGRNSAGAA